MTNTSEHLAQETPAIQRESLNRRDFIKLGMAGLALAVGPKLMGLSPDLLPAETADLHQPDAGPAHSWAMVIDQAKCMGCGYCTLACQASNDTNPDIVWNRVTESELINGEIIYQPVQCMHCEHAPCVHACPVKATYQRPDGIIMMDYDRCIGCRYCQIACPFGARSFNWEAFTGNNPAVPRWGEPEVPRRPQGVAEKCTFCYQRIDRGLAMGLTPGVDLEATPACVAACPNGARIFGDLNDPDSAVSRLLADNSSYRLREDLGVNPRVYYLPAHNGRDPLLEEASCS